VQKERDMQSRVSTTARPASAACEPTRVCGAWCDGCGKLCNCFLGEGKTVLELQVEVMLKLKVLGAVSEALGISRCPCMPEHLLACSCFLQRGANPA
jgi:hypothetical protein